MKNHGLSNSKQVEVDIKLVRCMCRHHHEFYHRGSSLLPLSNKTNQSFSIIRIISIIQKPQSSTHSSQLADHFLLDKIEAHGNQGHASKCKYREQMTSFSCVPSSETTESPGTKSPNPIVLRGYKAEVRSIQIVPAFPDGK
ncbi:hypothetical protein CEXT_142801 [Caerostris extrusa]|uniref:Uncharacterized protein n=1 Tax=Caerostris extrusa TaxID=172846 RepID=A0AAV4UJG0_CAEEX|nr:hypothetical protein CEXT_142801 [Caerostris extrusa]